jgi:hypothetical protein
MDPTATLNQAIVAIEAGRKAEARRLLQSVLDVDERNEQVWLLLSQVVEDDEERIICLENVLIINPHNETARKELAAQQAAPVADQPSAPYTSEGLQTGSPVAERPASPIESPAGDAPADHPPVADRRAFIAITIVLILILICTVVSILAFVILSPAG